MSSIKISRALVVATLTALPSMALVLPTAAQAREGGSSLSVGGGVKCVKVAVKDSTGKVTIQQICSRGI